MPAERYVGQVQLLLRAIPEIAREEMFALKGGTAINLFVRDLPRLSVDIDLVYLPVADRDTSLAAVRDGLARIADRLQATLRMSVARQFIPDGKRLIVSTDGSSIKIEVSPVLRGTVFEPQLRQVTPAVEERFGFAEMQVVSMADLYAGKIAAALDRQHPRDLFDVHFLLANDGIDEDMFRAFLVYLVSHSRPAVELLDPHLLDLTSQYDEEFVGMTVEEVPLPALIEAREHLVELVQGRARGEEARRFLMSFHALEPDWGAIGFDDDIGQLPAVRWKLLNLERLRTENKAKFGEQLEALRRFLED
ncbi:MAG: nucleotidyl transferase AbiEii/AbiGii toxin family protein [Sphingomicrobium sp.]